MIIIPLEQSTVIVVVDGAGGVAGSAKVADRICKEVSDLCLSYFGTNWSGWLRELDCQPNKSSGLAAAVIIEVQKDGWISGASVGDCEAWFFAGDHPPQDLTAYQNRKPLLGEGKACPIGFYTPARKGFLLVATDGLWKYTKRPLLDQLVQSYPIEEAANRLLESVRMRSGALQDDIAFVLVEIT